MGNQRTVWHVAFAQAAKDFGPLDLVFDPEHPLSSEPQRADHRIRRVHPPEGARREVKFLPGLWPNLPLESLMDFKSKNHPFRAGDLYRLFGYGCQYLAEHVARLHISNLALVLVTPFIGPALLEEIGNLKGKLGPIPEQEKLKGYYLIEGLSLPIYVVSMREVADAEQDELLKGFVEPTISKGTAVWAWWQQWFLRSFKVLNMEATEGLEELMKSFALQLPPQIVAQIPAEVRLASMSPEERMLGLNPATRLAGLDPKARLAGLQDEDLILGLSDDALRKLPKDYIATLSERVQEAIKKRLSH